MQGYKNIAVFIKTISSYFIFGHECFVCFYFDFVTAAQLTRESIESSLVNVLFCVRR